MNNHEAEENSKEIIEIAKKHLEVTYREGISSMVAVLLTKKGNIYTGINVKYKNIWKCICAERVAIAKAVEAGDLDFDTIVTVKYSKEKDSYSVVNMCGECRQIAICHAPLKVVVVDKEKRRKVSIEKMLPYPYI